MSGNALPAGRMPALIECYQADRGCLERLLSAPHSPWRRERLRALLAGWRERVEALPFAEFCRSDRADWILFRNLLDAEERRLAREERQWAETAPLLPFAGRLWALEEARRKLEDLEARAAAGELDRALKELSSARAGLAGAEGRPRPAVACRAAEAAGRLREMLAGWYRFHHGYDPAFTWWTEKPYAALDTALGDYAGFLRRDVAGAESLDAIVGDPVGRDALIEELAHAMIPYTPEELLAIGRREQQWCLAELLRAGREMGCGDDWRAAVEQVKEECVPPGRQPALVRDLAREAVAYVEEHDLVTVPLLARECWRMEMMSPEHQQVNPFFLGGEAIIVSYPTHEMEHERKLMSMRGNNPAFSRATVHHELIPGHHLQGFCQERYRPYRRLFYTPFWVEGWTLHWEMLLWERGFPRTPEERVGMLFWRLHRCARVVFSLGFHLGEMSAGECVEMLVNDVGHERDNALGEVRRSFGGAYDPLYQLAYLIGGLQVHALHGELTASGRMSDRQFHDAFLQENSMPIALLRALLAGEPLERQFRGEWRFYDA